MFAEISKAFDIDHDRTVYTHGDTIHNPSGGFMSVDLIAHECQHGKQHRAYPGGPTAWWKKYIEDVNFRLDMEIDAYSVQYAMYCHNVKDRNKKSNFLLEIAGFLSGPLYKANISRQSAYNIIKNAARGVTLDFDLPKQ